MSIFNNNRRNLSNQKNILYRVESKQCNSGGEGGGTKQEEERYGERLDWPSFSRGPIIVAATADVANDKHRNGN